MWEEGEVSYSLVAAVPLAGAVSVQPAGDLSGTGQAGGEVVSVP